MTSCTWRDCLEQATCSLSFGRCRGTLLVASYCDAHAREVEHLFRVEARVDVHADTRSSHLAPPYAQPRAALEAESSSVLLGVGQ